MLNSLLIPTLELGALYSLIALAWVVVFRATGVLNLATGGLLLVGGYFVFALQEGSGPPLFVSFLIALVLAGALGAGIYYTTMRPLSGRPVLAPIIVTLGIAIVIESAVQLVWGSETRPIPDPLADHAIGLSGGARWPLSDVIGVGAAFVFVASVIIALKFTPVGVRMRAAAEDPVRALQLGVRVHRMAAAAWGLAAVSAAGAGATYALANAASPEVANLGLKGLAPALLGGFESPSGAVLAAFVVAILETLAVRWLGGEARDVAPFVVLLVILLVRPQGFFGKPSHLRV